MKIICIGRNYQNHIKELKNEVPKQPLFFLKPETAIPLKKHPFYIPDFSKEVQYEVELVLKVNKLGKNIQEQFADRYFDEVGIGIDFTARDIQHVCKKKGLPWEMAKAFDGSAPVGSFVPKTSLEDMNSISFSLNKNGETVQQGNSKDMMFSFSNIISYVSKFVTLKIGDLIFTGTPAGVGPVNKGDRLEAFIGEEKLLTVNIK